eukprot:1357442-Amorphochlora_amoeboformis.AAC.1
MIPKVDASIAFDSMDGCIDLRFLRVFRFCLFLRKVDGSLTCMTWDVLRGVVCAVICGVRTIVVPISMKRPFGNMSPMCTCTRLRINV